MTAAVGAPGEHHRCADLHRWPFAPNGGADEHGEEGQRDFPQGLPQCHQSSFVHAVRQADGGDNLRDAATGDIGRVFAGEMHQGDETERQHEPRQERPMSRPPGIGFQRPVGEGGEGERGQRNQHGPDEQAGKFQAFARDARGLAQFAVQVVAQADAAVGGSGHEIGRMVVTGTHYRRMGGAAFGGQPNAGTKKPPLVRRRFGVPD